MATGLQCSAPGCAYNTDNQVPSDTSLQDKIMLLQIHGQSAHQAAHQPAPVGLPCSVPGCNTDYQVPRDKALEDKMMLLQAHCIGLAYWCVLCQGPHYHRELPQQQLCVKRHHSEPASPSKNTPAARMEAPSVHKTDEAAALGSNAKHFSRSRSPQALMPKRTKKAKGLKQKDYEWNWFRRIY